MGGQDRDPAPTESTAFALTAFLAVCGAVVVPLFRTWQATTTVICDPMACPVRGARESAIVAWTLGPGALLAGLVAARVSDRARRVWPYAVVAAQVVALVVIAIVADAP